MTHAIPPQMSALLQPVNKLRFYHLSGELAALPISNSVPSFPCDFFTLQYFLPLSDIGVLMGDLDVATFARGLMSKWSKLLMSKADARRTAGSVAPVTAPKGT